MYPWPRLNTFSPPFERHRGRVNHHWLSKQSRYGRIRKDKVKFKSKSKFKYKYKFEFGKDWEKTRIKSFAIHAGYTLVHTYSQCKIPYSGCL